MRGKQTIRKKSKIHLMRCKQTMRKTRMTKKRVRRARKKKTKTKMRKTKTALCNRIVTSKLKKSMLRNLVGIFRTQSLLNNYK